MNPRRIHELEGVRLAFAQGGRQGLRLVMLTPPVQVVRHRHVCELRWTPFEMPFRYDQAPILIDNRGKSDFTSLKQLIRPARRTTWVAKFSSKFRTRRKPLPDAVATQIREQYRTLRGAAASGHIANDYVEALPCSPNNIDHSRRTTYRRLLRLNSQNKCQPRAGC